VPGKGCMIPCLFIVCVLASEGWAFMGVFGGGVCFQGGMDMIGHGYGWKRRITLQSIARCLSKLI
jgi:hypothetical protein